MFAFWESILAAAKVRAEAARVLARGSVGPVGGADRGAGSSSAPLAPSPLFPPESLELWQLLRIVPEGLDEEAAAFASALASHCPGDELGDVALPALRLALACAYTAASSPGSADSLEQTTGALAGSGEHLREGRLRGVCLIAPGDEAARLAEAASARAVLPVLLTGDVLVSLLQANHALSTELDVPQTRLPLACVVPLIEQPEDTLLTLVALALALEVITLDPGAALATPSMVELFTHDLEYLTGGIVVVAQPDRVLEDLLDFLEYRRFQMGVPAVHRKAGRATGTSDWGFLPE